MANRQTVKDTVVTLPHHIEDVPLAKIRADFSRNVRMENDERYDVGEKSVLYQSMDANGFDSATPLVVSKRKDGLFWVIRGHRRFKVATAIHAKDSSRLSIIPCHVYEGLTEAEELSMIVDQFGSQSLNDYEIYLAIKKLAMVGLSEEAIGKRIGKSRGYVQRKLWVAKAPAVIEEAWKAKAEGNPTVNLTDPNLTELTKALTQDRKNGHTSENGGPEFQRVWQTLVTQGTTKPGENKLRSRKEMQDMRLIVKDPIVSDIINWACGDPIDLGEIGNQLAVLRTKAKAFDDNKAKAEVKAS